MIFSSRVKRDVGIPVNVHGVRNGLSQSREFVKPVRISGVVDRGSETTTTVRRVPDYLTTLHRRARKRGYLLRSAGTCLAQLVSSSGLAQLWPSSCLACADVADTAARVEDLLRELSDRHHTLIVTTPVDFAAQYTLDISNLYASIERVVPNDYVLPRIDASVRPCGTANASSTRNVVVICSELLPDLKNRHLDRALSSIVLHEVAQECLIARSVGCQRRRDPPSIAGRRHRGSRWQFGGGLDDQRVYGSPVRSRILRKVRWCPTPSTTGIALHARGQRFEASRKGLACSPRLGRSFWRS
jgi:hypothetical protein